MNPNPRCRAKSSVVYFTWPDGQTLLSILDLRPHFWKYQEIVWVSSFNLTPADKRGAELVKATHSAVSSQQASCSQCFNISSWLKGISLVGFQVTPSDKRVLPNSDSCLLPTQQASCSQCSMSAAQVWCCQRQDNFVINFALVACEPEHLGSGGVEAEKGGQGT